jgi:DNA polymerase-3 subunit alpha
VARPFVHLHGHTWYSLKDALSSPLELAQQAKAHGMSAVAVTDHRIGYGLLDVYFACKNEGVKPILGCELNEHRLTDPDKFTERKAAGLRSNHLPVLARNLEGYQNLCHILTYAATAGLHVDGSGAVVEEVPIEIIATNRWGKGIIALTGCISSRLARIFLGPQSREEKLARAALWVAELLSIFDEVYLEMQFHSNKDQQEVNLLMLQLYHDLHASNPRLGIVATRDYHYIRPDDGQIHDVYIQCSSANKSNKDGWRTGYDSHDYYFCHADVMYEWADQHEDYKQTCAELGIDLYLPLETTQRIADSVDLKLVEGKSQLPRYPVPEHHTESSYLRKVTLEALALYAEKLSSFPDFDLQEYIDRLEWELRVICDRGSAGYMLILWDLVNWCLSQGIIVGPGRGSGAGSLLLFLLNITRLDPIEHGLLFQRFLSPDRMDEPDVDIDFPDDSKADVVTYLSNRWGSDYVAQIGNHNAMAIKKATQELGKQHGMTHEEVIALTKPLPNKWVDQTDLTFQKLTELAKEEPDYSLLGDLDAEEYISLREKVILFWETVDSKPGLRETIERVSGAKASLGVHAGGVIISPVFIRDLIPLTGQSKRAAIIVTQYNMDGIAKLGFLKFDILSLKTLTVIRRALELIRTTTGDVVDLYKIPRDDRSVYRLYQLRRTHGVFQASGKACQQIAGKIKPSNFTELVALLALN